MLPNLQATVTNPKDCSGATDQLEHLSHRAGLPSLHATATYPPDGSEVSGSQSSVAMWEAQLVACI